MSKLSSFLFGPTVSLVHQFHKPPYGGGNQFMLALRKELERRQIDVAANKAGRRTRTVLFNSFNFDFDRLRALKKKYPSARFVHRVDGPVSVYRGQSDPKIDVDIQAINNELADATIFQSAYSLNKHKEMRLEFKDPVIIPNACDPEVFSPKGRIAPPDGKRKVRILASAWSSNPKKGGPFYKWLDEHLDEERYQFTFIGQISETLTEARHIMPVHSRDLAEAYRNNDIFLTASEDDPCSNSLIEALASGLPAVFLRSGGHPELVGEAGVAFSDREEALAALDQVAENYTYYQKLIRVLSISEVADKYLAVMKIT